MLKQPLLRSLCLLLTLGVGSCTQAQSAPPVNLSAAAPQQPPPAPREFRAAWIASVNNSQWPKADHSTDEQKRDMITILDRCVALNLNAVVVQIRPGADALYKSDLEPWSEFLTGQQGQAPSPYYDPMELWITEAHRRGLEFHAWFNPYRVSPGNRGNFAPNSVMKTHPEIVRQYGSNLWMDPGEPLATQQALAVLTDIVRRYDIDGLHTDDYYYPYRVEDKTTNKPVDFPDGPTYQRYQARGGKLARDDWRRHNIDQLVEQIYTQTHKLKPWVKVGYAPFGIWKNGVPTGTKGLSQTDVLYSDPKLWLNKGWLDYLSPQLYWHIGGDQDFKALFEWWLSENTMHRHVWPGLSLGKNGADEILDEINLTRRHDDPGVIFWNISGLEGPPRGGGRREAYRARDGEDISHSLLAGPYAEKALVPASPWLDHTAPPPPIVSLSVNGNSVTVALKPGAGETTWVYAIYVRYGNIWRFTTLPGGAPSITLNPDTTNGPATTIVVSAIDRTGNESLRAAVAAQ